jgi:hypothetical protein
MTSVRLALAVALSVALFAPRARAQNDTGRADALLAQGRDAAERGDWAGAYPKLAESERLDPSPGTLLFLADCEEHLHRTGSAWEHFRAALETMPPDDDRILYARQRMASLDKIVPHLTLAAGKELPLDAQVRRDDVLVPHTSLGRPIPVDPGSHVVTVVAGGHRARTTTLTLKAGDSVSFPLAVGESDPSVASPVAPLLAPPAAPVPVAPPAPAHRSSKTVGWVLGGVGVVSLGASAVTGVLVLGKRSTVHDPAHCDQVTFACDAAGVQAASDGRTLSTISTVAFVAGAAALGVGAYLVLTHDDGAGTGGGATGTGQASTLVGPSTVASGAGMRLVHIF